MEKIKNSGEKFPQLLLQREAERKGEFREIIEKDFDWLKAKLSLEDYEKLINQRMVEFKDGAEDLEFANSSLEEADGITREFEELLGNKIEELRLAKIDTTTDLKIRSYFFSEAIPQELSKVLGREVKDISNGEWLELLMDETNDLEKIHLTVVMTDLSYLSVANRDGHASGDALLGKLGEIAAEDQKTKKHGHRYGGDEFSFLFNNPQEAEEKMKKLQESFSKAGEVSNLANYGLEPNLDVGQASFSEAVMLFRALLKTEEGKAHIEKDKVFKEFNTVWMMLADKRSLINKAQKRIPLLAERYQEGFDLKGEVIDQEAEEHYNFLVKYLGKGAYEISKKKIAEIIKESGGDGARQEKLVWDYIKGIEKGKLSDEREYSALRDRAIAMVTKMV